MIVRVEEHVCVDSKKKLHPRETLALKKKRKRQREEFIAGRCAIKKLSARNLHLPFEALCVINSYDDENRGKPILLAKGLPVRQNISISHDDGMVMVAISEKDIGVDVLKLRELPIAYHCLSSDPQMKRQEHSFINCMAWAIREAFVKALGVGFRWGVNSVAIEQLLLDSGTVIMNVSHDLAKQFRYGIPDIHFAYDYLEGYIFLVCYIKNKIQ
ncbi:MAG: hypothetical protein ACOYJU_01385 [Anaerovoracaceae bacterium]